MALLCVKMCSGVEALVRCSNISVLRCCYRIIYGDVVQKKVGTKSRVEMNSGGEDGGRVVDGALLWVQRTEQR